MQPTRPRTPFASLSVGRLMWWLYNIGMLCGLILFVPLLVAVAVGQAKRRQTFRQRLGVWRYPWQSAHQRTTPTIWVHALSVGEVTAAQSLVYGLAKRYPGHRLVLTASTQTGYETACSLFADSSVDLAHFPYDLVFSVRAMAEKIDPVAVILIETDIWPNFLHEMQRRNVPVHLANFRMSDSTWRRCSAFKGLLSGLFNCFEKIGVQTGMDAQRLERLGVDSHRIRLTGNLKFDSIDRQPGKGVERQWRQMLGIGPDQTIILAGSTHDGDEHELLNAFEAVRHRDLHARLIIAPRDPGRSRCIVTLCNQREMRCRELSAMPAVSRSACPDVVVVDYIGVLKELYSIATVAFIGGTWSREGGHNPLEPAACAKPIFFGPDMRDFRQIAGWLLDAEAAQQVADGTTLGQAVVKVVADRQKADFMGAQALTVFRRHQGAVARTLDHLSLK